MEDTIERLENSYWGNTPADATRLVSRCYELRKKAIKEMDMEDTRLLIGQDMALPVLIPMAMKILTHDILAEGDFYPGDLLKALLTSDRKFWEEHDALRGEVIALYEENEHRIAEAGTGVSQNLAAAFKVFSLR